MATPPVVTLLQGTPEYAAAQDFLREHLSPALTGDNWDSLIAALSVGDTYNRQNARLAFDQLFRSSASGQYLDRRMNDYGVRRPSSIGMADDLFRDLGINLSNDSLTNLALWKILEVYYGADAVRSNLTTTVAEPYAINDGDTLVLKIDERNTVIVTFAATDFKNNTQALALEVAAVVNRSLQIEGLSAYAVVFLDPNDGKNYVRIYSGALGLIGTVRILGGPAQNALLFPSKLTSGTATTQWTLTFSPGTNTVHMEFTAGGDPLLDNVRVGDYVNIYGTPFNAQNRGTFVINAIYLDGSLSPRRTWIEFTNASGKTETITQVATTDVIFFRPLRSTGTTTSISTADKTQIAIQLPATTQAVNRAVGTGAYLHAQAVLNIQTLTRVVSGLVTVTTQTAHGLATNALVFIDGAYPPAVTSGGGGLNGAFVVTVLNSTQFTYQTPEFLFSTTCTSGTVLPVTAIVPDPNGIPGPYIFDPRAGLSITSVNTTVAGLVSAGQQQRVLAVANASQFPDAAGWLVIGFGTSNQQGPIQYSGRVSNTQLLLDPSYTFKFDAAVGTDVTLLLQKGAWVPDNVESVGAFYVTASPAGRVAASSTIDDVVGAGFNVKKTTVYPGDRGLGAEGGGFTGQKLSDVVSVWAGDTVDTEVATARSST